MKQALQRPAQEAKVEIQMSTFSAGPQALGYLYQARVALAVLLEAPDEAVLRVEALDDIELVDAIESGSLSLIQLKHHVGAATLTDSSVDLWKSLRVWSEHAKQNKFTLDKTKILLLTTASVNDGSIAALLGITNRKTTEASARLLAICDTSTNKSLAESFAAFKSLSDGQRISLLSSLIIVPQNPDIAEIKKKINQLLRVAVRAHLVTPFSERVEGWWTDQVILHLLARTPKYKDGISAFVLHEQVAEIAESFREENLPIDFDEFDPSMDEVKASENKQYVVQLRAINANARTIRKAILDYHRAFNQRHRWLKDSLLLADELEKFEEKLRDEWERYFDLHCDDIDPSDAQALIKAGKAVLKWAELECALRIRPRVYTDYIRRGSFHMLADKKSPEIHWHPLFKVKMEANLAAAA